jgi:hypothetical protein
VSENNAKIEKLEKDILRLEAEKTEREAALPVHSVRPRQLMAIEELEEEIARMRKELKSL